MLGNEEKEHRLNKKSRACESNGDAAAAFSTPLPNKAHRKDGKQKKKGTSDFFVPVANGKKSHVLQVRITN